MTLTQETSSPVLPEDQPRRTPFDRDQAVELGGAAIAALVLVWVPFHLTGWNAPQGLVLSWFVAFAVIYGVVVRQRHGVLELKDRLATLFVFAGCLLALVPLFFLLWYVVRQGLPVVAGSFPKFLLHDLRNFGPTSPVSQAGLSEAIVGTLEQVGLATVATVPIGVLAATYLNEIGARAQPGTPASLFATAVRTIADAMTGLPTIIAGLFVYTFWIEPRKSGGYSGLAAAMALAIVMLPTVVRVSEEVLRIVSDQLREAALALGAPEWRMILRVVIPTARTGLVTASILGVARAVGETAPVLLTSFGNARMRLNPFHGAQDDLPYRIFFLVRSPSGANIQVAWGGAFVLTVIILTLFVLARILGTGGTSGRRLRLPSILSRRS